MSLRCLARGGGGTPPTVIAVGGRVNKRNVRELTLLLNVLLDDYVVGDCPDGKQIAEFLSARGVLGPASKVLTEDECVGMDVCAEALELIAKGEG
jgi:hypothetical protein